ncbi:2,3-bisphosphoglycerate-dependent phosphoglycerate mutase [Streptomyces glaucescens]
MARPRRIVLVRHGESTGNVDDSVYEREPDHALALTERGRQQAEETGKRLRELFGRERVSVYVSPYRRTHETLQAFHLDPELIRVREEPRLREQDWGNWQDRDDVRLQKAYRDAYGHFFYRGPLTVRPDLWDQGIGRRLMEPVMDRFDAWGNRHLGLFTFSHSRQAVSKTLPTVRLLAPVPHKPS